jgi:urease accessory protein
LLLLADGRFPAGGHAHSGGMEAAISLEGVDDIPDLEVFLLGRAATAGAVAAAFAAATCSALSGSTATERVGMLDRFDRELDARLPSPALRAVSRRLGRQLLRAGRVVWPGSPLDELVAAMPHGLHQPVALGAVAAAAGLGATAVAAAAVHEAVAGPATAAVRLLGLDPFTVHATLARIGPELDAIATRAALHAHAPPEALPAWSSPLLDILAEHHTTWEVRLFAS